MDKVTQFINLPLKQHLVIGTVIRLILIVYGDYHDKHYDVPYTDVDYKVFSDAARHVFNGNSPYRRHTYRYSPIIAYLLLPNMVLGKHFGKLLFAFFDILITLALKILVQHQYQLISKKNASTIATYCSLFWLYNPLSIGISTRGSADSVSCFIIILSLMFLQTDAVRGLLRYGLSGAMLGIAIHMRLYPLAFSFPMFLSLGDYSRIKNNITVTEALLSFLPTKQQFVLALSCVVTLVLLTLGMYSMYGYEFLFETYIFHLFRKDTKHNFSVLFYYSYLTMNEFTLDVVKTIAQVFEMFLLVSFSLVFGCDPSTLPFALFGQSVVLVIFNSVMTSQYFVWFLSLLPLVVHSFKMVPAKAVLLCVIWFLAQGAWLFYAYLLEFQGRELFIFIWLKGVVFFCANCFILSQLVKCYVPGFAFGLLRTKND